MSGDLKHNDLIIRSKRKAIILTCFLLLSVVYLFSFSEKRLRLEAQVVQSVELFFEQFEMESPRPIESSVSFEKEKILTVAESDFKVQEEPVTEKVKEAEPARPQEPVEEKPLPKESQKIKEPPKPKEIIKPKEIEKKPQPKRKVPVQQKKEALKPSQTAGSAESAPALMKQGGEDRNAKKQQSQIVNLLVALVERKKRYPKVSRRSGQEGTTEILFRISPSGQVISATTLKTCEYAPLNKASEEVGQKIVGTDLGVPNKGISVVIPVRYQLN